MPRVISLNGRTFNLIRDRRLSELMKSLENGEASIYDVAWGGVTLLEVRIISALCIQEY